MENENLIETKERMLNVFRKLDKITSIAKKTIIVLGILIYIICFIMGFIAGMGAEKITDNETIIEFFNGMSQEIEGEIKQPVDMGKTVTALVALFVMAFTLDKLEKIFHNTVENKTPFSNENIKGLKQICIASVIACIVTVRYIDISFVYAIAMSAIYYIFKFGYILQKESDETL